MTLGGFCNFFIMATQRCKRTEDFRPVGYRHSRMLHQEVPIVTRIRQVDNVFVIVCHLGFMPSDLLVAFTRCGALLHVHPFEYGVLAEAFLDGDLRLHHLFFAFDFFHVRK